jgi:hypothetical protein
LSKLLLAKEADRSKILPNEVLSSRSQHLFKDFRRHKPNIFNEIPLN